jgi:lipoprotein-anchoring transpeptidase ErfK/SrfK
MIRTSSLLAVALLVACGADDQVTRDRVSDDRAAAHDAAEQRGVASDRASGDARLAPEELEAGRMDGSWRAYAERRTGRMARDRDGGRSAGTGAEDESWDQISVDRINAAPGLPVFGDVEGPSVAKVQILLTRARFSPGIIDGRWGKNTEQAVYWFQDSNGLDATGEVDQETFDRLASSAGAGRQARSRRLTEQDVAGPFVAVPEDIYERAELECLCYESLREKLGEVFRSSPELLEQLNPGVDLNALAAGDQLNVPAVEPFHVDALPEGRYTGGDEVQRIVVSGAGHYLHAFDGRGTLLYHFPSTLGADYSPSPEGEFSIESVTFHPDWHYQPELLTGVDPDQDDAVIPAGPNNDVGVVWMNLSKPHYGVHGTKAPETIGYATSNGCIRLTNWDAAFLARRVPEGVTVEFVDVEGRGG